MRQRQEERSQHSDGANQLCARCAGACSTPTPTIQDGSVLGSVETALSISIAAAPRARRTRAMSTDYCVCGHPRWLHRPNRQIGDRNECWSMRAGGGYCGCRQFQARDDRQEEAGRE